MYDTTHKTVSLADRVFDKLEDDILFGRYAKGEILTELRLVADTLRPLHRKIQNYRRSSMADTARARAATQEHRAIFEAMAAGDAERAKTLTVEHITNAKASILGKEQA